MIRIFINDDRIGIPIPVADIDIVERRHAEKVVVEPETLPAASLEMVDVARPESSGKPAMLKRVIDVKPRVVPACVVPNPFAIGVDVGRIGMAGLVGHSVFRRRVLWRPMGALRSVRRKIHTADARVPAQFPVSFASPLSITEGQWAQQECH
jgi:hypothetical protein